MEKLELVKPNFKYERGFKTFIENYKSSGEKLIPFDLKYYKSDFKEYVAKLLGFPKGIGVPEAFIEHSTFWLVDDEGEVKGVINIRHRLNESLKIEGGHIGYGVAPMYRRKGYGTKMLKLAFEKAKGLGIEKVLITCDKENIGSAKVAINNGGILDSEDRVDGREIQRYWINLDK